MMIGGGGGTPRLQSLLLLVGLGVSLLLQLCQPLAASLPPHSGYHGRTAVRGKPFFEGWYLRVVTPSKESFAFIFHIFDPHYLSQRRGVGMQLLTPQGTVSVDNKDVARFRARSHQLHLQNRFNDGSFFQLTADRAYGRVSKLQNELSIEFDFEITPQVGWGGALSSRQRQYSTAGWLAAFPIFEPHYQVLMSKGVASGGIAVTDAMGKEHFYNLTNAVVYLEKNWGGSFPSKWWWIQANTFPSSGLTVTSTGGRRRLPLTNQEEEVALVGIHWNNQFLPFTFVQWMVQWGKWRVNGQHEDYSVTLTGSCSDVGFPVRCPTDSGMKEIALETFQGMLRVELYRKGRLLLNQTTSDACLEIGGMPWSTQRWNGKSEMVEPLKSIVMNTRLERMGANALQMVNFFIDVPGL